MDKIRWRWLKRIYSYLVSGLFFLNRSAFVNVLKRNKQIMFCDNYKIQGVEYKVNKKCVKRLSVLRYPEQAVVHVSERRKDQTPSVKYILNIWRNRVHKYDYCLTRLGILHIYIAHTKANVFDNWGHYRWNSLERWKVAIDFTVTHIFQLLAITFRLFPPSVY